MSGKYGQNSFYAVSFLFSDSLLLGYPAALPSFGKNKFGFAVTLGYALDINLLWQHKMLPQCILSTDEAFNPKNLSTLLVTHSLID
jgi:hypothetical protein